MTAREAALKALYSIDADGAYINAALSAAQDSDKFSVSDRALITELIYGVVSERTAEDYIISRFSKVKIKKMTPWILNILRTAALCFISSRKRTRRRSCILPCSMAREPRCASESI